MKRAVVVAGLFVHALGHAEPIQGVTLFNDLVSFDSSSPGTLSAPQAIGNLVFPESVQCADFLVDSGEFYVLTNAPGAGGPSEYRLRLVNLSTEFVGHRIVFHDERGHQHRDGFPGAGRRWPVHHQQPAQLPGERAGRRSRTVDGNLAYAVGDVSFGVAPNVTAIATAALSAGGTTYGVDADAGRLVSLAPDNSGVLHTVGPLGITLPDFATLCFDISTTSGTAYLGVGDNNTFTTSLYTVNLSTGAATLVGTVGSGVILRGMSAGGSGGGGGVDITWIGGNGVTSLASNWDPAQAPASLDTVRVQSGAPEVDASLEVLRLVNQRDMTFSGGSLHIHSSLENSGSLFLGDRDITFHGSAEIQGAGTIHLAGGRLQPEDFHLHSFVNRGNRITGHGLISAAFNNDTAGTITAGAGTLTLDQPGYNDGFFNAAAGATLSFSGFQNTPFDNSGGTVRALAGGRVFLAGGLSAGEFLNQNNDPGALTGAVPGNSEQIRSPPGAGVFLGSNDSFASVPAQFSDTHGTTTLGGTDINGDPAEFTLLPGRRVILDDSLELDGVIRSYGLSTNPAIITVEGDVLLGGTGRGIELGYGGADADFIAPGGAATNKLYLLPLNSISGGGVVQADVRSIQGFIVATRVSATTGARRLALQGNVDNFGFMRAMDGGQMDVYSPTLAQWSDQAGVTGVVQCAANSTLFFVGTEILGGSIRQEDASAILRYFDGTSLNGAQGHPLTLAGTHDMVGPGGAFLDGEHDLAGEIFFENGASIKTSAGATLNARGATDLTGFGLVWLGADGIPGGIGPQAGATLTNHINISGRGQVGGAGEIVNEDTARIQAHGGALSVSGGDVWNTGAIEAGGRPVEGQANVPGALTIASRVFMSGNGAVRVNNDLGSLLLNGATLSGGTLYTRGAASARAGAFFTSVFDDLDLAGDFGVPSSSTLLLDVGIIDFFAGHEFPDSYIMAGDNAGGTATVEVRGAVTLRNLGGIWLKDPANNGQFARVQAPAGGSGLLILEDDATLRGSGFVDIPVSNPSGRILAGEAGNRLIFAPGALQPQTRSFTAHTAEAIRNNPGLVLPDTALGVIEAAAGAQVVIQQAALSGQQFLATGTGRIVFTALSPVLSNLHAHLSGTAMLVASNGLRVANAVGIALVGNQLPGLSASAGCGVPTINTGSGPVLVVKGADLVGQDGASIVGQDGASIVGQDGASIVGQDGASIVGQDGASIVAGGGGNIVAAGGGNIVAAGGGNIVAAGGGNIVAAGGGNIVAAGGGNIANRAAGNIVAGGGLNAVLAAAADGNLQVQNGGRVSADNSSINLEGGTRTTTMLDNQSGGNLEVKNQSCLRVPDGRINNQGTLKASQSNVVASFFQNAGNAVVSGVNWAWNGTVGAVTGVVNGVGGVINATGSLFRRIFGGAGLSGGGGFALAAVGDPDASDFINDGTIILGDTICTNTFDMGFTQTATGRLGVQLGGVATNTYDRLFIHGPAVLGGVLQLVFTNNFAPALGDTFDFLVCPDVMSDFDSVEIAGLPPGHNWQFHSVFTNGAYRVVSDSTVVLPLAAFRGLHGLASDGSQDFANPSGDHVPNLFKYAFRLAENAGDLLHSDAHRMASVTGTSGLPALFRTGPGTFELVFVRRKAAGLPGIAYHPEITGALNGAWTDLVPDTSVIESLDPIWERVRLGLTAPFDPPYDLGGHVRVRVERE
ncbi:MAG: DUF4394 domain-containing protein [Kiritimatiellia bacterium]